MIAFPMNGFPLNVNLYLAFLALPLLTQCGDSDSEDYTLHDFETPDEDISITEEDLRTLQSGDGFEISEKDQLLVVKMAGSNQASLKFVKIQGSNKPLEGASSSLTWQAQGAGSFIYTLTIESTSIEGFGRLTAIVKALPNTATKETGGKIIIQTELQSINQSTLPPHGDQWIKPTFLLIQKY